jgi:hypothetical protein
MSPTKASLARFNATALPGRELRSTTRGGISNGGSRSPERGDPSIARQAERRASVSRQLNPTALRTTPSRDVIRSSASPRRTTRLSATPSRQSPVRRPSASPVRRSRTPTRPTAAPMVNVILEPDIPELPPEDSPTEIERAVSAQLVQELQASAIRRPTTTRSSKRKARKSRTGGGYLRLQSSALNYRQNLQGVYYSAVVQAGKLRGGKGLAKVRL